MSKLTDTIDAVDAPAETPIDLGIAVAASDAALGQGAYAAVVGGAPAERAASEALPSAGSGVVFAPEGFEFAGLAGEPCDEASVLGFGLVLPASDPEARVAAHALTLLDELPWVDQPSERRPGLVSAALALAAQASGGLDERLAPAALDASLRALDAVAAEENDATSASSAPVRAVAIVDATSASALRVEAGTGLVITHGGRPHALVAAADAAALVHWTLALVAPEMGARGAAVVAAVVDAEHARNAVAPEGGFARAGVVA